MEALGMWILGALILFVLLAVLVKLIFYYNKKINRIKSVEYPKKQVDTEISEEVADLPSDEQDIVKIPELPDRYDRDTLILMLKDPYCLYIYWEISITSEREFIKKFGTEIWNNSATVLRLYDVTDLNDFVMDSLNCYKEVFVTDACKDVYINVDMPNRKYCVIYGKMLPNGRFVAFMKSNYVKTPRANISELSDEEWQWIRDIYYFSKDTKCNIN